MSAFRFGASLFRAADGAATAPSHSFANDSDSGWYRVSADVLALATAGTDRILVGPGVRIGTGITDPGADNLSVVGVTKSAIGSATNPSFGFNAASGNGMFKPTGGDRVAFATASTERLRITETGDVQMGSTPATVIDADRIMVLRSYTVATLPSAATKGAGAFIYVSDEVGGAVPAFSDGTNWLRVTDRAIVA